MSAIIIIKLILIHHRIQIVFNNFKTIIRTVVDIISHYSFVDFIVGARAAEQLHYLVEIQIPDWKVFEISTYKQIIGCRLRCRPFDDGIFHRVNFNA